jgi:hypothetical protein
MRTFSEGREAGTLTRNRNAPADKKDQGWPYEVETVGQCTAVEGRQWKVQGEFAGRPSPARGTSMIIIANKVNNNRSSRTFRRPFTVALSNNLYLPLSSESNPRRRSRSDDGTNSRGKTGSIFYSPACPPIQQRHPISLSCQTCPQPLPLPGMTCRSFLSPVLTTTKFDFGRHGVAYALEQSLVPESLE